MSQYQPQQRNVGRGSGSIAMTWQTVLVTLLFFAFVPLLGGGLIATLGMDGNWSPQESQFWHRWVWPVVAALGGVIALLLFSHFKRLRRPDLAPDLLGMHFHAGVIYQTGPVHAVVLGFVVDDFVRLIAFAQNRFTQEAEFRLHTRPNNRHLLHVKVPPAAVMMSRLDLPLATCARHGKFREQLFPSAGGGGGQLVRFAMRQAPTTETRETLLALAHGPVGLAVMAIGSSTRVPKPSGGLHVLNRHSILEIPVPAAPQATSVPGINSLIGRIPVSTETLWSPDSPHSPDHLLERLSAAVLAEPEAPR